MAEITFEVINAADAAQPISRSGRGSARSPLRLAVDALQVGQALRVTLNDTPKDRVRARANSGAAKGELRTFMGVDGFMYVVRLQPPS